MEFDWILFREATKKVEEKNGYVIQNFRVTDLLIDAQNRISGIKGKSESEKKEFITDVLNDLNLSVNKAEKDIGLYKSSLTKLQQAKELLQETKLKRQKK